MRDDRVEERVGDAEREIDPELRPLCHRAPDDGERHAGEHDLEQVTGRARDRGDRRERRRADVEKLVHAGEEAVAADQPPTVAEGEGEASGPVDDRADGEAEQVLERHVSGVLGARHAGLEQREPALHEHHENRCEDDPDGVGRQAELASSHCRSFQPTWIRPVIDREGRKLRLARVPARRETN